MMIVPIAMNARFICCDDIKKTGFARYFDALFSLRVARDLMRATLFCLKIPFFADLSSFL